MSDVPNKTPHCAQTPDSFQWNWITWALMGVLSIMIGVAFAPAAKASFVDLDDELYVFNNPHVLNGLSLHSIKWAMTTREGARYMPTAWLCLQLDATISNMLNANDRKIANLSPQLPDAVVYHVSNIVMHGLASWLLFLFLYRTTRQRWASFTVALIWAVHPLRVESVAWVTECKDEVAGVFGFLAMYLYVAACERQSPMKGWRFWAACMAMVLSLWAKAMFVTMPCLLLIMDYWPLGLIQNWRDFRRVILQKWPMWVIAALSAVGTIFVGRSNDVMPVMSHLLKAENAFISYSRYIIMHVDFRALAPYYPFVDMSLVTVLTSIATLITITIIALWLRHRQPWLLAGWIWYLVAFLPMIGFLQSFTQAYADRFSYLPSVGLLMIVVFAVFHLRIRAVWTFSSVFALAIVLTVFSFKQSHYWHDSITLFERARAVTPSNVVMHSALGNGYLRAKRYQEAEQEYQEQLQLSPQSAMAYMNLALVHANMKQFDQAEVEAKAAIELQPEMPRTYTIYGTVFLLSDRYEEAAQQFEKALQISPNDAAATMSLHTAWEQGNLPHQ